MRADYPTTIAMTDLALKVLTDPDLKDNHHVGVLTGFKVDANEGQNPPCIVFFMFLNIDLDGLQIIMEKFKEVYPKLKDTILYSDDGKVVYQLRFDRETLENQGKVSGE